MRLVLEQMFYGRGQRGYAVLGASPGAQELTGMVESLCGAAGTPGLNYDGTPFLWNIPVRGRCLMICGRNGPQDSMRRRTLFFHILVAPNDVLSRLNITAMTLFRDGVFSSSMPEGEVCPLSLEMSADKIAMRTWNEEPEFPAVIRASKPSPDAVCAALGEKIGSVAWSTFSFADMTDFDLQVLPQRISISDKANVYDVEGKVIKRCGFRTSVTPQRVESVRSRQESSFRSNGKSESEKSSSGLLVMFLIVTNILFALGCLFLWTKQGNVSVMSSKVRLSAEERKKLFDLSALNKREDGWPEIRQKLEEILK